MIELSGIWVPLVTPFRQGRVDEAALQRLVVHLGQQGVAGFVACGSTGEAAMLDEAEQHAVLATVQAAAGDRPVLMGLSGVRAEQVAERALRLCRHQAAPAGWLLSPPAYVKPPQAGLRDFFLRVADTLPGLVVAYDVPSRTGVRLAPETLLALAAHPRIRAVKDCSADAAAATHLLAEGRLAVLAGNDDELFAHLALGAVGGITATAHLRPAHFVHLHRLVADQRLDEARRLWYALRPLTAAAFAEPNPMPVKGWLAAQGWMTDECRAPMQAARPETVQAITACLARLDGAWPAASVQAPPAS